MAALLLKKGDKGENVKILQKALGVNADGVFGSRTESAVKSFQKANGLYVDGLVGNATQKALGISFNDDNIDILQCGITLKPITNNITKYNNRAIKYIVIHYTAGVSSASGRAAKVRDQFQTSGRNASADFCVDDKNIIQCNPDMKNYYTWAVGDGNGKYGITNANSISIEMCSNLKKGTSSSMPNHEGWTLTGEVLNNTENLVKYLMAKYNIPSDNIVRHYDASRKSCPGIIGWNDAALYDSITGKSLGKKNNSDEWELFKKRFS